MASFTETTPLVLSPYRSKVDADAYTQVGLMAQQQYDTGLSRIQNAYDQVAGLEIANPYAQQHFQQQFQNLQNESKQFVGADFRDQSIVNKVISRAARVAKDPIVSNAVLSTQKIKKGYSEIEKLRSEGKTAPENEWDYEQQVKNYLNSDVTKNNQAFNGVYTPYRDVKKKALDALKAINPNVTEGDFALDGSGNLTVSDAILRTKFKGISPQQIKSAIYASLDAGDLQQLQISGRYSYSNATPEQLRKIMADSSVQTIKGLQDKKKVLEAQRDGLSDINQKSNIQSQIDSLDQEIQGVTTKSEEYNDAINKGNLDYVRSNIYLQRFFDSFGNAFSYSEVSNSYVSNPILQAEFERQRLLMSKSEHELKKRELELKQQELRGLGGVPTTIPTENIKDQFNFNTFQQQTADLETSLTQEENQFLTDSGRSGDKEWLNQQRALYDAGKSIDPVIAEYFRNRESTEKVILSNKQLINKIESDADSKVGQIKQVDELFNPIKLNNNLTFSPSEILEFDQKTRNANGATKLHLLKTPNNKLTTDSIKEKQAIWNSLTDKEKRLLESNILFQSDVSSQKDLDNYNQYITILREAGKEQKKISKDRNDYKNEQLINKLGINQGVKYNIVDGKVVKDEQARDMINSFVERADKMEGSFGSGSDDAEAIRDLNNREKVTRELTVIAGTKDTPPSYRITLSDGKESKSFIISQEDKRSVFGNKFEDQVQDAFSPVQRQLTLTGNRSTNFGGTYDPVKASVNPFFTRNDFSGVRNFAPKGDIQEQNGGYALVMYIPDPKREYKLQRVTYSIPGRLMNKEEALLAVRSMSDEAIYQLLYGKAPSLEELKEIQQLNNQSN